MITLRSVPSRVAALFVVMSAAPFGATAAPVRAAPATRPVETWPVDSVRAGQQAIVRTVFQGSTVEAFDAEILGVIHNGHADGDLIVARATSERVVRTGIAQGMSGSPVYVGGRLIGALSSGWQFSKEPLFGITPIGEMLDIVHRTPVSPSGPSSGPSGAEATAMIALTGPPPVFGVFRWDDDAPVASVADAASAVPPTGLTPLGVPLACDGLAPAAFEFARQRLAPLQLSAVPGGRAAGGGPTAASLEAGSAVAVDLMRGDLQFSAIGTATWVEGGKVLAFGHPFFQSGDVRLPLATAEIATIVPSTAISFKLGMRGRTIGAIQQDRRAGIAGTIGASPHMLPLSIAIHGDGPPQSFHFETLEDRNLAPVLVSVAALNSIMQSGGGGTNQTLRWTLTLHRHGMAALALHDIVAGESPPSELANAVLAPIRFLMGNPYAPLTLDSLAIAIDSAPGRAQWTLRNARVLDAQVRPGGRVRVACDLERWRGGRETRVFSVEVPEELPEGRYALWIGGGQELMRYEAQRLPGRYRPVSLDDAWRRLRDVRPADALYVALFARAPEVTTHGRDYPELPESALPLLASETSSGDASRRGELAKFDEQRYALGGLVHGELVLPVDVDAQAP